MDLVTHRPPATWREGAIRFENQSLTCANPVPSNDVFIPQGGRLSDP